MSDAKALVWDHPASVTLSDTVNDPAGPFAALLITGVNDGNVQVWPSGGPLASSGVVIAVKAGTVVPFPIVRVGATNTTVTVLGLIAGAVVRPGAFTV